ncbi:MAG: hypothetical protein PVG22_14095, partial [Chromatiales bacterium]
MARSCLGKRQGGLSTILDQTEIYQGAQLPMRPMVEPILWLMLAMLRFITSICPAITGTEDK